MPGSGTEVPRSLSSRADALLRSLVGVTASEVCLHASGSIECVRIVSDGRQSTGQVVQNVRSALLAGLGVKLKVGQVELVEAIKTPPVEAAHAESAPAEAAAPAPIVVPTPPPMVERSELNIDLSIGDAGTHAVNGRRNGNGTSNGNGHANGNGNGSAHAPARRLVPVAAATYEPLIEVENTAPRAVVKKVSALSFVTDSDVEDIVDVATQVTVEKVELIRQAGRVRCRVVLAVGSDRFSAVADAAEDAVAEIQLAGRVTTDALRAGNLTTALFEAATVAYLAGRVHVVVALTDWRNGVPVQLTGSAVVHQTLEQAAAMAVLQALPIRKNN